MIADPFAPLAWPVLTSINSLRLFCSCCTVYNSSFSYLFIYNAFLTANPPLSLIFRRHCMSYCLFLLFLFFNIEARTFIQIHAFRTAYSAIGACSAFDTACSACGACSVFSLLVLSSILPVLSSILPVLP